MNINEIKNNTIIYVDMDGTLAKWNNNASREEVGTKGYFTKLQPEPKMVEFVKLLADKGFNVEILSAVYNDNHSSNDKTEWLRSIGLDHIPRNFVPYGSDKSNAIKNEYQNHVLIDDYGKNLSAWSDVAIKFYNGINNMPKITFSSSGYASICPDTWNGLSISKDMSINDMFSVLIGSLIVKENAYV